jgi:DNA-binding Lrp family transcriptional regulator
MTRCFKKAVLFIIIACMMLFSVSASFSDISEHWAKSVIEKWEDSGIVKGSGGKYRPNDTITRAEFSIIMDRLFGYTKTSATSFLDVAQGSFYADAVSRTAAAGVILGSDGLFRPMDIVTRQEVAAMISRAFKLTAYKLYKLKLCGCFLISQWARQSVDAVRSGA